MGRRLRDIRESQGLTQNKLAEADGLTPQAITQIETGKRQPSGSTLIALARGLRLSISLDSLLGLPASGYPHDVLRNADALAMAEKTARMPAELQEEVKDVVDFVWGKRIREQIRNKK